MDTRVLFDGLIAFLCFIPILTVHEWAHAWTADKCGDDTARLLGRMSFNPLVHIDPIGTLALPFLGIALAATGPAGATAAGFVIGWGKPVPVNIARLRNRQRDNILVAMAGPAMNVVLAIVVLAAAKLFTLPGWSQVVEGCQWMALISLYLCFFNLLPIPPLDGSHVMRYVVGMGEEAYFNLCRYGLILVIVVLQVPGVRSTLREVTYYTYGLLARALGV
jgi:Zn-dependent protease